MATVTSKPNLPWAVSLWIVAVSTFLGYHLVNLWWGLTVSEIYFYVMKSVLGLMLSLTILVERHAHPVYVTLAAFCGLCWFLNAACGFSWYVLAEDSGHTTALCTRDHGWIWLVIVACVVILWGLHARRSAR